MRYSQPVSHTGLNKHKVVSDSDPDVLSVRVKQQLQAWDEEWRKKCEAERKKALKQRETENQQEQARKRTADAQSALTDLSCLLTHAIQDNHALDWKA